MYLWLAVWTCLCAQNVSMLFAIKMSFWKKNSNLKVSSFFNTCYFVQMDRLFSFHLKDLFNCNISSRKIFMKVIKMVKQNFNDNHKCFGAILSLQGRRKIRISCFRHSSWRGGKMKMQRERTFWWDQSIKNRCIWNYS